MPKVAILSFHSHDDRSFLDDRELALASGDLRRAGVDNDLVVAHLPTGAEAVPETLVALLEPYDTIVYERVWSPKLVEGLRARLEGRTFVACQGEHRLIAPPADLECRGDLRRALPALFAWLAGERAAPPGTRRRGQERWERVEPVEPLSTEPLPWEPNMRPVALDPEALDPGRAVSVVGNPGCPYQADARDNPLYADAKLPDGVGRGCAFCTTGNRYEHSPPAETAARVLDKLRYLRREAPERMRVVLKDQNPFGWLPEVVEAIGAEGLGPLTLMLETRVDWFVRNERRFERALELASDARVTLAPYLIGIESFSQAELDRFNKGMAAEDNVAFLERIDRWEAEHPRALDLSHASFGFVLFTPWTTLDDLRANHRAIVRTGFDRFRGSVLLARARLYPDTALYWLAERDGLLTDAWDDAGEDSSARYGYFPGHPWRFVDPTVARLSRVATTLSERGGSRDQRRLFGALLAAFSANPEAREAEVLAAMQDEPTMPTDAELRARLAPLLRPIALDGAFAGGWRIGALSARPGRLRLSLDRQGEEALVVDLVPRSEQPAYARSRHYDVRHVGRAIAPHARRALEAIANALRANDR